MSPCNFCLARDTAEPVARRLLVADDVLGFPMAAQWLLRDPRLRVFPGNFMYFVGYSKWLLLGSRLVAGEAHVHTRAHEVIQLRVLCQWAPTLRAPLCNRRCGSRSRLVHLWVPDPQHAARGARRHLRSRYGVQTGRLGRGSVSQADRCRGSQRCLMCSRSSEE